MKCDYAKKRDAAFIEAVMNDNWEPVKKLVGKVPEDERVMKAGVYKAVKYCIDIPTDVKLTAIIKCSAMGMRSATDECYAALLISLEFHVMIDDAFKLLEGKTLPKRRTWTPEEIQDIDRLRQRCIKWNEIADMFCVSSKSVTKIYHTSKSKGVL